MTSSKSLIETSASFHIDVSIQPSASLTIRRDGKNYVQHTLRLYSENVRVGESIMDRSGKRYSISSVAEDFVTLQPDLNKEESLVKVPRTALKSDFFHVVEEEVTSNK